MLNTRGSRRRPSGTPPKTQTQQKAKAKGHAQGAVRILVNEFIGYLSPRYHSLAKVFVGLLTVIQSVFQAFASLGHFLIRDLGGGFDQRLRIFNHGLGVVAQRSG